MIAEANELIKINSGDKNIIIKLPMTLDGLEACRYLTKKGVKTNVTLIFSVNQALLAARAGATKFQLAKEYGLGGMGCWHLGTSKPQTDEILLSEFNIQ